MAQKKGFFQRLLHLEPGIALGQWIWDRISNNWPLLTSLFVGLGGMSYLASISEILEPYGPAGIGAVAVVSVLVIWIALALVRYLSAKRREKLSYAEAIDKWKVLVDKVNPLDKDFRGERIFLSDLAHPISKSIENKTFYDCELFGPANLMLVSECHFFNGSFSNCDIVVTQQHTKVPMHNVIALKNVNFHRTEILGCTIFIHPGLVGLFKGMGANFVTLTGDADVDNQLPPSTPA